MPIYEFTCQQCEHVFEELLPSGTNGKELHCPSCGGDEVHKRMSTFAGRMGQPAKAESSCPTGSCCFGGGCGH